MKDESFSFGKSCSSRQPLRKSLQDILLATTCDCPNGWYFIATIVSPIEPFLDQNEEIRLTFKVAEGTDPSNTLRVILGETSCRRYLPILKNNQDYRFKDGDIIIKMYENNFVFMPEHSDILMIEVYNDATTISNIKSITHNNSKQQQSSKSKSLQQTPQLSLKPQSKTSKSLSLDNPQKPSPTFGSVQLQNKTYTSLKTNLFQYADFKGKVLCQYPVGRDKFNHGTGYQIEEVNRKSIYEVVIWSEVGPVPPLVRGRIYEFKSFKVHKKRNYEISFHSHFQHSSVQELN